MPAFHLPHFIKQLTGRNQSYFGADLVNHSEILQQEIEGKKVLVIGGAGTIGSSYIKALLPFKPAALYVIDTNENGLTELVRDIRSTTDLYVPATLLTYPMDFGSPTALRFIEQQQGFDIIANFAALKHVRTEKDEYCVEYMIDNNVLKAEQLLQLILKHPPKHFFCVSTDKAANPVNVMGASKKLMEEMVLAYSSKMKITTARFANVLFSNGSLPEGFLFRIQKHQPLSAPNNIKRFFVSPEEAGQLCLLACLLGKSGDIFVPKFEHGRDEMTFDFIAEKLLAAMGYSPIHCKSEQEAKGKVNEINEGKYPCFFSAADTTGEKGYEEFWAGDELVKTDSFQNIAIVNYATKVNEAALSKVLGGLNSLFDSGKFTKAEVVKILENHMPTFVHEETGKYLDSKM